MKSVSYWYEQIPIYEFLSTTTAPGWIVSATVAKTEQSCIVFEMAPPNIFVSVATIRMTHVCVVL